MKSVALSLAATGIIQVLNIVSGVLAARYLLPEGRGELAAVLLWPGIVGAIASLSLEKAVAYRTSLNPSAARRLVALSGIVSIPLAGVGVLAGYFLIPVLLPSHDPDIVALSQVFLLVTPAMFLVSIVLSALQGLQRFWPWNIVRILPSVGYVTAILFFLFFGATTVRTFVLAFFSGSVLAAVAATIFATQFQGNWLPRKGDLGLLSRYALGIHFPVVGGIAGQHMDKAIIAFFLPANILGVFVVSLSATSIVHFVGASIGPIAFARTTGKKSNSDKAQIFGRFFRLTLATTGGATIVLWLSGQWLIVVLFGAEFSPAGDLLPFLLIGTFLREARSALYQGLKACARLRQISVAEYASLFIQTIALVVLLPRLGLIGVAIAIAVSAAVGTVLAGSSIASAYGQSVCSLAMPRMDDYRWVSARLFSAARRYVAASALTP